MIAEPQAAARPLAGIKVLDLSRIIAGPLAGELFAGLGAEVVKVETPDGGDPARHYLAQGYTAGENGLSPLFEDLNRDKKSVVLDLKSDEGRRHLLRMAKSADVLIHNFRPGVADRLGVGYDAVSAANPRLVYCSISGFGDSGPFRTKSANDVIMQAFGGVMSFTGPVDGPVVRAGVSVSDYSTGLFAAIGTLAALMERTVTGRGRHVRTSLFESTVNVVGHNIVEYWINGYVPAPLGTGTSMGLPNEAFPTTDGSVLIAAVDESLWRRLCIALGEPELAIDPRFVTLMDRRAHRSELRDEVSRLTHALSTEECLGRLDREGVPCGPINRIDEVVATPQFSALDLMQEVPVGDGTTRKFVRLPFSFDGDYPQVQAVAPALGVDTERILEATPSAATSGGNS